MRIMAYWDTPRQIGKGRWDVIDTIKDWLQCRKVGNGLYFAESNKMAIWYDGIEYKQLSGITTVSFYKENKLIHTIYISAVETIEILKHFYPAPLQITA